MTKIETINLEKEYLDKFLNSEIGKNWYIENSITRCIKSEQSDFVIETQDNKNFGIEITQFFCEHKNLHYSQALTRIGNQICKLTKEKYKIGISIVIDRYDKRKFSPKWNDHLDYAYNPCFENTPSANKFKKELEKILIESIDDLRKNKLIQKWIEIQDEYYKISMQCFPSIISWKFDCHVNNAGEVKFNLFNELQICIDKKNKKIKDYCKNLNKLFLLIIVPDSRIGNYCTFTNEINSHKFISDFDAVFLYDENQKKAYILNT